MTNNEKALNIVTRLEHIAVERQNNRDIDLESKLWSEQWHLKLDLLELIKEDKPNE